MNKVAYYIVSDGYGGAENVVWQTLKSFKNKSDFYLIINNEISGNFKEIIPEERTLNIGSIYIHTQNKYKPIRYLLNNRFFNFRKLIVRNKTSQILDFCSHNQINIIHTHLDYALYSAILIKMAKYQIKLLHTVHGAFALLNNKYLKPDIPNSELDYTKIDHTIFVAKYLSDFYQNTNISIGPHSVIYNGIEQPFKLYEKKFSKSEKEFKILFVGGAKYVKGYDILINSITALLNSSKLKFKVTVLGHVPLNSDFRNLVESNQLNKYFDFHGFIAPPIHLKYFANHHVLIMPSRSEALPIAAIEAISYHLPVIASNVGGIKEVVINGQNGVLCEIESDVFSKAIMEVSSNYYAYYHNYCNLNLEHIKKFNINLICDKLNNLYREVYE